MTCRDPSVGRASVLSTVPRTAPSFPGFRQSRTRRKVGARTNATADPTHLVSPDGRTGEPLPCFIRSTGKRVPCPSSRGEEGTRRPRRPDRRALGGVDEGGCDGAGSDPCLLAAARPKRSRWARTPVLSNRVPHDSPVPNQTAAGHDPEIRKLAISRVFLDGETRTRTGDTTIFSGAALGAEFDSFTGHLVGDEGVVAVQAFPDFADVSRAIRQSACVVCLFVTASRCESRARR
jgi:hypothetical protein